jgi:hypothetical protein
LCTVKLSEVIAIVTAEPGAASSFYLVSELLSACHIRCAMPPLTPLAQLPRVQDVNASRLMPP